ncbi:hypothetical protein OV079_23475 [Nannocystis pusilla]|uniref:Uncharacterized protein n=1 Tax=Nannocystis pusilla TaxID=889268 RepID=A0A9X3EZD2_9BACT|nr:hypothetical protein [Nannocystis pusilla]MCY1008463.1 hypothetical protein [Nannocystis pusilla]
MPEKVLARPVLVKGDARLRIPCAAVGELDAAVLADAAALTATLQSLRARHGFGRAWRRRRSV